MARLFTLGAEVFDAVADPVPKNCFQVRLMTARAVSGCPANQPLGQIGAGSDAVQRRSAIS